MLLTSAFIFSVVNGNFIRSLLSSYDKFEQPIGKEKNVTSVECFLQLIWLHDVDATKNVFNALVNLNCDWYDPRLTWASTEFSGKLIQVNSDLIWLPIFEFNGVQPPFHVQPRFLTIFQDGRVVLNMRHNFNGYCTIESEFFPYDSHSCYVWLVHYTENSELTMKYDHALVLSEISPYHSSWWIHR